MLGHGSEISKFIRCRLGPFSKQPCRLLLPLALSEGIHFPIPSPPPAALSFSVWPKRRYCKHLAMAPSWVHTRLGVGRGTMENLGLSCKAFTFDRKGAHVHSWYSGLFTKMAVILPMPAFTPLQCDSAVPYIKWWGLFPHLSNLSW